MRNLGEDFVFTFATAFYKDQALWDPCQPQQRKLNWKEIAKQKTQGANF